MPRQGIDYDTIIRTAAELADSEGYAQVTLASVAAALQVRTPSLYNHVKGLPGLRNGLALYSIRELGFRMGRAAIGRAGEEAVRAVCLEILDFARSRPGLYEASLGAPDPEETANQEAAAQLIDILLSVLRDYRLEGDEALHVVRGLRSLTHGFISLEAKGGFGMDLSKTESYNKLLDIFLAGMKTSGK